MPETERPYEKACRYGVQALSDAELLAVVLRTGTRNMNSVSLARKILSMHPIYQDLRSLNHLSRQQLVSVEGIGEVKATQLLCVAELAKRIACTTAKEMISYTDPQSIAAYYMEQLRHLEHEELWAVFFDYKCRMICDACMSIGTTNCTVTTPRDIYTAALRCGASHVVILHNHPSGDCTPSRQDHTFTRQIAAAGDMIGIPLADHIVIGDRRYFSMKERGFM